jgi:chromosomal replication initiator protein
MKTLTENIEIYRQQSAALLVTINAITRILDVKTTNVSHSKRISIIQRTICEHFDLPVEAMHSRARTNRYVTARHIAIYLSRELTKHSLAEIAKAFRPDMDHGTACFAVKCIQNRLDVDKPFNSTIALLRNTCAERITTSTADLLDYAKTKKT